MSWIVINTKNGVLKLKPRWQLRTAERKRKVGVLDLGLIIISWWSHDDLRKY